VPEVVRTCELCGAAGSDDPAAARLLGVAAPFAVAHCDVCDLRWLSPRPDASEYAVLYGRAYYGSKDAAVPEWLASYPLPKRAQRHEGDRPAEVRTWSRRQLARLGASPGATLLEIGAGIGSLLAEARALGFDVTGLEPSAEAVAHAKADHGIDIVCGDVASFEPNGTYDVIVMSHVAEHLPNPRSDLARIASWLAPEGTLLVEVPNQFASWTAKARNVFKRNAGRPSTIYSIHHTYFFDAHHITALLHDAGLTTRTRSFFSERRPRSSVDAASWVIDAVADRFGRRGTYIEVVGRSAGALAG
jgi:2-polyprenyl-3-methyl-5-hydroxy-6-metoxy-1,4-benzoquinol methylase